MNVGRPPLVGVLGSGGAFGIGVHFGVARAFEEVGIRLAQAPLVGSSAGAYAAGAFVSALDLDTVLRPWGRRPRAGSVTGPSIPFAKSSVTSRPATMCGVAARLFGHGCCCRLRGTASWTSSPHRRHHLLSPYRMSSKAALHRRGASVDLLCRLGAGRRPDGGYRAYRGRSHGPHGQAQRTPDPAPYPRLAARQAAGRPSTSLPTGTSPRPPGRESTTCSTRGGRPGPRWLRTSSRRHGIERVRERLPRHAIAAAAAGDSGGG